VIDQSPHNDLLVHVDACKDGASGETAWHVIDCAYPSVDLCAMLCIPFYKHTRYCTSYRIDIRTTQEIGVVIYHYIIHI
jgi:hypothetical protein